MRRSGTLAASIVVMAVCAILVETIAKIRWPRPVSSYYDPDGAWMRMIAELTAS